MYQRDYLVRMIEEMAAILGKAVGLREQSERIDVLHELDELMQKRFRINGGLADRLTADDLQRLFTRNGAIHADELQAFAYLLLERAKLEYESDLRLQSDPSSARPADGVYLHPHPQLAEVEASYIQRLSKALTLLLEAMLQGSDRRLVPAQQRALEALELLKMVRLDDRTLHRLWRWHETDRRYAEAEDALFRWLQSHETQSHGTQDHEAADEMEGREYLPVDGRESADGTYLTLSERIRAAEAFYDRLSAFDDAQLEQGGLPRDELQEGLADVVHFRHTAIRS
ncbi:DUF6483 family protein [Paenibacillus sp. 481]|uniref:DUF6483 family protein n=1 Tax=Paenibacillus sp. 481 TaxID=2835869 RepID=UPI001E476F53|nr:DUF6483 family protein [Paenibacillus sp. 481]UHA74757.1 hypothetical protein KIK04_06740 [Paenibacillus sp. 481]